MIVVENLKTLKNSILLNNLYEIKLCGLHCDLLKKSYILVFPKREN